MSNGTLAPTAWQFHVDAAGLALNGGLLYTYEAGTTTPADTWNQASMINANLNTNPIVLNTAGIGVIYLAATSYKFVLKTSAGVTLRTQDNISAVGLTTSGVVEVFQFAGDPTSPITDLAYPVGNSFVPCHAGTTFWVLDSNTLAAGTYKLQGMLGADSIVTAALINLSQAPETPVTTIATPSGTAGGIFTSAAITWGAGGVSDTYGIKVKVDTGAGFAWGLAIIKS